MDEKSFSTLQVNITLNLPNGNKPAVVAIYGGNGSVINLTHEQVVELVEVLQGFK